MCKCKLVKLLESREPGFGALQTRLPMGELRGRCKRERV